MTRPIIAKFSSYPVKEAIIERLRELGRDDTNKKVFKISEDFSKGTQAIRKKLLTHLKIAKGKNTDIAKGHLKYKTLVVRYSIGDRNIYKHFSLNHIEKYPNTWYKSPTNQDY